MKYLVETFGCQMNFHDSERMAGLLEQAGYEPADDDRDADVIVINTCSVRERAEEKLYTRLGEIRADGPKTGSGPSSPSPAASRSRKARSSSALERPVDVIVGTQSLKRLPMLVAEAAARTTVGRAPRLTDRASIPYDDVSFPLGVARREDPLKAYVTIIEGCNEFCAFCVVPYTRGHERMRPCRDIVAEVAARGGHRRAGSPAARADRQPLPGAGRPGCDFAELLERVNDVAGIERIRFASPHPRHVTPRMIAAMRDLPKVCRTCTCRCSPARRASCRRCAGATRARNTSSSSAACARPCRTSRCRPI